MPKIVDRDMKKKEIARAAIEVFSVKGFENTTIQDIAEKACIGKGTFYQYFETKEHILIQVSMELFAEMEKSINSSFHDIADPSKKLSFLIEETITITDKMEKIMLVNLELWLIHMRKARYGVSMLVFEDMLVLFRNMIAGIIEDGKKSGIFKQDADSRALSIIIVASIDGIGFHYLLDKGKFDLKKISREFINGFFNGLLA